MHIEPAWAVSEKWHGLVVLENIDKYPVISSQQCCSHHLPRKHVKYMLQLQSMPRARHGKSVSA